MPRLRTSAALRILFFLSGATGLVYQVVWLRELILVFGATVFASSAVLATFMGGLALGSYWASRRADGWRVSPLRAYGYLELGIAAYAAVIPFLLHGIRPALLIAWRLGADSRFVGFGLVKFAAIALLILPATTLMGATLPVLARAASTPGGRLGGAVGALYAANTFGAVVGTVAAAFVALPLLGNTKTLVAAVGINAAVGFWAWWLGRGVPATAAPEPAADDSHDGTRILALIFAASGCAAMVLEVAWTRGLALVLGSSVYAYAAMLSAFLVGLAAGALAASRLLARRRIDSSRALAAALVLAGGCAFATSYLLQSMPRAFAEIYFRLAPSPNGWLAAEVVLAACVMAPTTFLLGWVFPLVLDRAGRRGGIASSVGGLYAANTLGTIVGATIGGFLIVPRWGVSGSLVAAGSFQVVLGAIVLAALASGAPRRRVLAAGSLAALAVAFVAARPRWDLLLMNSGVYMNVQDVARSQGWGEFFREARSDKEVLYARDGLTASVLVAREPTKNNVYLAVNGKVDASSREDLETQIMLGHIPLLFHPAPRNVLIVGLASGITVGAAASHPVESIRVVEIERTMLDAARCFAPYNGSVLDDPRVSVSVNDARNELELNPATYDVIVSEPSNPWMTVASNLFTQEFFGIVKSRLRPGGVFGQWVQAYCLEPPYLRSILAAIHGSFPHVTVFETGNGTDFLVVGSDRPLAFDRSELDTRMSDFRVKLDLARVGVSTPEDILAMLQTGGSEFERVVRGSRKNTDDNGLVEFAAPKALYVDSLAANLAMLQEYQVDPMSVVLGALRTPGEPDALRLELIPRWIRRGQRSRAERGAELILDPKKRETASEILRPRATPRLRP